MADIRNDEYRDDNYAAAESGSDNDENGCDAGLIVDFNSDISEGETHLDTKTPTWIMEDFSDSEALSHVHLSIDAISSERLCRAKGEIINLMANCEKQGRIVYNFKLL